MKSLKNGHYTVKNSFPITHYSSAARFGLRRMDRCPPQPKALYQFFSSSAIEKISPVYLYPHEVLLY